MVSFVIRMASSVDDAFYTFIRMYVLWSRKLPLLSNNLSIKDRVYQVLDHLLF